MRFVTGARWSIEWRNSEGNSCLHLIVGTFPPARDVFTGYCNLLKSCIQVGLSPSTKNFSGRSALHEFCEILSKLAFESHPESSVALKVLLEASTPRTVSECDRSGRSILDIRDQVSGSCLAAARPLLQVVAQTIPSAADIAVSSRQSSRFVPSRGSADAAKQESAISGQLHSSMATKAPKSAVAQTSLDNKQLQQLSRGSGMTLDENHTRNSTLTNEGSKRLTQQNPRRVALQGYTSISSL